MSARAAVHRQGLMVRARERRCVLPLEVIVETMRPRPTVPLPGAPAYVLGMAQIRGVATPVVDLGALLGDTSAQGHTRVVTLRATGRQGALALAVEAVLGLCPFDEQASGGLPALVEGLAHAGVGGVGLHREELLLYLREGRLVPEGLWEGLG